MVTAASRTTSNGGSSSSSRLGRLGIVGAGILVWYGITSWRLSGTLIAQSNNVNDGSNLPCPPTKKSFLEGNMDFLCQDPAVQLLTIAPPPLPTQTRPKVLCLVLTHSQHHETRLQSVLDTWGAKCDHVVAASNQTDVGRQAVRIESLKGYWGIWDKLVQALKQIVQEPALRKHQDFDWVLKADDDTYMIMENLYSFLSNVTVPTKSSPLEEAYDPSKPTVYGRTIAWPRLTRFYKIDGWFSKGDTNHAFGEKVFEKINSEETLRFSHGGPGYVMNWAYVQKLVEVYESSTAEVPSAMKGEVAEDMANAMTMLYHEVRPSGTADEQGRERMHPESPQTMYANPLWLGKMHHGIRPSLRDGADCCAPTSISYHYVADFQMRLLDYQLYKCPASSPPTKG